MRIFLRKGIVSLLILAMMFGLIPGLNPGLPVYAASGTVTFSAANRTNLGQTIHDGDWGSTDIPGIQLDIFNANTGAPSTAVGSFPYFTAAELWDTTFGGIAPIDTTSGYVVSDSSNVNITPKIIVIKSNNGAEFQFKGFYAVDYQIRQLQMTVEGFRDGSSTGFVTLNTDDSVGITYTTSDLTPAKFQNVDEIRITNFSGAGNWVAINNIVIGDPVGSNTAPTFVGATTTLTVNQNAAATDIKGLLHASDSDSGQTLTWSQNAAPSHGTLSFSSATASSGSTDITPGGTITYTPTSGYAGSDSFTVRVSDGTATATRTITVTVNDVTAPTLTAGAVNRTSDTEGTIKFTSDEAGQYYYSVVADGAAAPTIDTSGAGTACTTSETTITNPTGLTAGAKDIYIKVKDASGNVSDAIKIDITAYVAPDITAPILTAGAVNRTSDTAGTVKFTSDEAGQYYYSVVTDGAAIPTIDTSGAGTACTTSETTITNPTGLTAGAKDIYIKVKDASGNVSDAIKIDIAAYVAADITAPILTAGAVNRTSDTEGTIKFTSDEAGQYYYSVVADGAAAPTIDTSGAGTSCTTSETTITNPTGLTAGAKDIYLKVKDASGNVSDAIKIDIAAYVAPSGDSGSGSSSGNNGGSGTTTPSQPSQGSVIVIVNGIEQNAGTETKTTEGGQSVVTVAVNNTVIESKINDAIKNNPTGTGNIIQVPVTDTKSDVVKVELTGDIIKKLEDNNFQVSVKRDAVEYILPAEELTIGKIAESLGVKLEDLKDIKTEVKIAKLDQAVVDRYNTVAKESGAELIFAPVAFEIVAKTTKADGTTSNVQISKFSNYVERIMEIPAGVDPSKITTGIVFNPDGTYSHVPTEVFQRDGKWYARLNSLTNSNYSVVWNPVTVKSVEKHWAKDAVNDMASRLVIFNPESFDPNKAITRADFAEYIVRALGLYRVGSTHDNKFKDVSATGDRTLAILIASEYGIVTGYPDGTFRSDALITREEAMTMYQRAMKVTKLVGKDDDRYQNFTDYKQVGSWATSYVQAVLSAHVFNGTTATTISPKSNLTYAEAAQAIKNLLVESKLINK